jgi:hypothetical protein
VLLEKQQSMKSPQRQAFRRNANSAHSRRVDHWEEQEVFNEKLTTLVGLPPGHTREPTLPTRKLVPLEPEIRDAQADGVVAHDALNILREAVGGLGIDVLKGRFMCLISALKKNGLPLRNV